jgi:hypothetical protein
MTTRTATRPNFFRVNFTAEAEFLMTLKVGEELRDEERAKLSSILSEHDPKAQGMWVCDKDDGRETNVCKAEVFYNDLNHNDLPTNPLFRRVVGVNLGDCTRIYLHFNA